MLERGVLSEQKNDLSFSLESVLRPSVIMIYAVCIIYLAVIKAFSSPLDKIQKRPCDFK